MNDLDLITQLRPDEPLAAARELAPARRRLTDAIAAELSPAQDAAAVFTIFDQQRSPAPAALSRPVRPGRRRAFAFVALTAAAAGIAATVLLAAPGSHRRPTVSPSTASSHPAQAGRIRPFTGRLTAARFLDAAARAALTQPARPPRPGQFVYAETEGPGGSSRYQIWQSADGSQSGLVINGQGAFPLPACTVAQAATGHCATTAGYLPGLPVRPRGVLAYLTKIGLAGAGDQPGGGQLHKAIPHWVANDLGKTLAVLLSDTYLQPAQRAALYQFMARTPGFAVAGHVTDAIGRPGVGIQWTYQGIDNIIIFSRQDYAYLGEQTIAPGQPAYGSALVKFGIVAKPPPHATASPAPEHVLKGQPGASPVPSARG